MNEGGRGKRRAKTQEIEGALGRKSDAHRPSAGFATTPSVSNLMGMPVPSLLIVEDHDEVRNAIAALLTRAGYLVRTARDAEEALVAIASMPRPCLVLWDPVSHRMSLSLIAQAAFEGIHIATIPVGIAPAEPDIAAAQAFTKRLTSPHALMSIVKEHCPAPG